MWIGEAASRFLTGKLVQSGEDGLKSCGELKMKEPIALFALLLLWLCQARTPDSVVDLGFNMGGEAKLNCSCRASSADLMYVIWKVELAGREPCQVGSSLLEGKSFDSCADGKSLRNVSESRFYLHIPNFSRRDAGSYRCETVFKGGTHTCNFSVSVTVPPRISSWLEVSGDSSTVAVCTAEDGKPAARIRWRHAGNASAVETERSSGGFFSVESRLKLPESAKNVTCIVKHPFWREEKMLAPKHQKGLPYVTVCILIVASVLTVLATFSFLIYKKQIKRRNGLLANRSPPKSEPTEEVEEVEPYASYVQRVNSIYNL
ncbi:cell surface glycoprotein CD200 receptor 1-A isoform X2 [Festucalex cinctus]